MVDALNGRGRFCETLDLIQISVQQRVLQPDRRREFSTSQTQPLHMEMQNPVHHVRFSFPSTALSLSCSPEHYVLSVFKTLAIECSTYSSRPFSSLYICTTGWFHASYFLTIKIKLATVDLRYFEYIPGAARGGLRARKYSKILKWCKSCKNPRAKAFDWIWVLTTLYQMC